MEDIQRYIPGGPRASQVPERCIYYVAPLFKNRERVSDKGGYHFAPGAKVKIVQSGVTNSKVKDATNVGVVDSNTISCTLNLRYVDPGAWDVVVTNPDGETATLTGGLTVTPHPVNKSITPTSYSHLDPNASNLFLTINGTGYQKGVKVKLTRYDLTPIDADIDIESPSVIKCYVNIAGAHPGYWKVEVTNPDGGIGTPNLTFRVL